ISTAQIAAGQGDSYLVALNQAISQWGKAIYIRPMAEMNNGGNPWHGNPDAYRKAFERIYLFVHGGSRVNARLASLGMPPVKGTLASNPMPRVRVLWSPLAGGDDFTPYWPGNPYVDVAGADIYKEAGAPPWQKFIVLYGFAHEHRKPFSVPEWGLFGIDDKDFVPTMCTFLKSHVTETAEFYESKPGSIFDLGNKPLSRAAYASCLTPFAGPVPSFASGGPGSARGVSVKLAADQHTGASPLDVTFTVKAKLTVPVAHWTILFGDGAVQNGDGAPPATVSHTYAADGAYTPTLFVFASSPFTPSAAKFYSQTTVTVGAGGTIVGLTPTPAAGKGPLKVSFKIDFAKSASKWQLIYGDGLEHDGSGKPPHFAGHTYTKSGMYHVVLVLTSAANTYFADATIRVR
ncbi:MAG TPA: hypothetical protein VGU02_07795, partial [Gaiellaceae bacterium]|nr:hypothetical protein [Gaiellaceae bacterium]